MSRLISVPYIERKSEPTDTLISVADAKAWLKVTSASEDLLIERLVETVTLFAEEMSQRAIRETSWYVYVDRFDRRYGLQMPIPDISKVSKVEYLVNGSWTTLSTDDYYVRKGVGVQYVLPTDGTYWPSNYDSQDQAIRIQVKCLAPARVVSLIEQGMYQHLARLHADRGDMMEGGLETIAPHSGSARSRQVVNQTARVSGAMEIYLSQAPNVTV